MAKSKISQEPDEGSAEDEQTYTLNEFAALFSVTPQSVRNWENAGIITRSYRDEVSWIDGTEDTPAREIVKSVPVFTATDAASVRVWRAERYNRRPGPGRVREDLEVVAERRAAEKAAKAAKRAKVDRAAAALRAEVRLLIELARTSEPKAGRNTLEKAAKDIARYGRELVRDGSKNKDH